MAGPSWSRRDFLRRTATASGLALGALGGVAGLGACTGGDGDTLLQRARQTGSITVGMAGQRPFGYRDGGAVTGQAPEVARAVFQMLGVPRLDARVVEFTELIPALNANRFDVIAAGMVITPARCGEVAFSVPDYQAPSAFLVPRDNPDNVTRFEDVAQQNVQLAVLADGVERDYALQSGVGQDQLLMLEDAEALLQAVAGERADAAALARVRLTSLVQRGDAPDALEVTPPFKPVINGRERVQVGGFAFREQDDELRRAFDEELQSLQRSGRWLRIVRPFGFTPANLPPPELSTEQLCGSRAGSSPAPPSSAGSPAPPASPTPPASTPTT